MSLTDTIGSLAVATKGQYMTGVSVDIGTSFVKPGGRVEDELTMKAVVTGIGASDLLATFLMPTWLTDCNSPRHDTMRTSALHTHRQVLGVYPCRLLQLQRTARRVRP